MCKHYFITRESLNLGYTKHSMTKMMNQLFHTNDEPTIPFQCKFQSNKHFDQILEKYGKAGQKHIGVNINFGHTTITSINLPFKFKKKSQLA